MHDPEPPPPKLPAWQTCLDFGSQSATHYHDHVNEALFGLIEGEPRRVLELGCAGGMFGARLKQRYPGASVVGIEAGAAAAQLARDRLDRVIHGSLDDIDFEAHGIGRGEFDTVIAADVLEHLANPWRLLQRLKPHLEAGAQVIASIPNARNIWLVGRLLLEGRWEYTEHGLLDVTHLRFFTLEEIRRMFVETGYRVDTYRMSMLPSLVDLYRRHEGKGLPVLQMGKLTLKDVSAAELAELCTEQFLLRCRSA